MTSHCYGPVIVTDYLVYKTNEQYDKQAPILGGGLTQKTALWLVMIYRQRYRL
jgi:hypothetical protein